MAAHSSPFSAPSWQPLLDFSLSAFRAFRRRCCLIFFLRAALSLTLSNLLSGFLPLARSSSITSGNEFGSAPGRADGMHLTTLSLTTIGGLDCLPADGRIART